VVGSTVIYQVDRACPSLVNVFSQLSRSRILARLPYANSPGSAAQPRMTVAKIFAYSIFQSLTDRSRCRATALWTRSPDQTLLPLGIILLRHSATTYLQSIRDSAVSYSESNPSNLASIEPHLPDT